MSAGADPWAPGRLSRALRLRQSFDRGALAQALRAGPWLWPSTGEGRQAACEIAGLEGPPAAAVGCCPAISVHHRQQSLWLLQAGAPRLEGMLDAAQRACEGAAWALGHLSPLAWGPQPSPSCSPRRLWVEVEEGHPEQELPLDGGSLGLSAALAQASLWMERPLRGPVLASACLGPRGELRRVEGLGLKARLLGRLPPGRLLVAAEQAEEWRRALPGWEICGWTQLAEVIEAGLQPLERLAMQSPEEAAEALLSLLQLTQEGRAAALAWGPIHRAALSLLARPDLPPGCADTARFVGMVAARYARQAASSGAVEGLLPWAQAKPPLLRAQLMAHLIQERSNAGEDLGPELEAAVRPQLDAQAAPHAWKLRGAAARHRGLVGDLEGGLALHRALVLELEAEQRAADCSYSLCEWLRLAGALGRPELYEEALHWESRLLRRGLGATQSSVYLDLAAGAGALELGRAELACQRLERACRAPERLPHRAELTSRGRLLLARLGPQEDAPPPLETMHLSLDRLWRGQIDLEACIEALRPYDGLARRLAQGQSGRLLRFFPY